VKRTRTSKAWMSEHVNDHYVQRAKAEGWRSRAAFKLMEIDDKLRLLRPGMTVVDLGAAPGSWAQVAVKRIQPGGHLIAVDLLPMEPIAGATMIEGDFGEDEVLRQVATALAGSPADLVLSDMAPNMSGIALSDQARSIYLAELTLDFCRLHLKTGGHMVVKVFQGSGFMELRSAIATLFAVVQVEKPAASRGRSAETYLVARQKRGGGA